METRNDTYWFVQFHHIRNFLASLIAIASGVAAALTIVQYYSEARIQTYSGVWAITLLAVVFGFHSFNLAFHNNRRFKIISEAIHQLNHLVRDTIYEMQFLCDQQKHSAESLGAAVNPQIQNILDHLVDTFEACTNKPISANLKVLEPKNSNGPDTEAAPQFLVTVARSTKNSSGRADYPKYREISHYYGFDAIVNHNADCYFAPNVRKYKIVDPDSQRTIRLAECRRYKRFDAYKSGITVPIKIRKEIYPHPELDRARPFVETSTNTGYFLMGLLSIDSTSTSAFRNRDRESYLGLMRAFSNGLFKLLDKYHYYDEQLRTEAS